MKNITLHELSGLEFHDGLPVKFEMDLESRLIKFGYRKEFESPVIELIFINVSFLNIISLAFNDDIDIDSVKFDNIDSVIAVSMVFNLGSGQPTSSISFKCDEVKWGI